MHKNKMSCPSQVALLQESRLSTHRNCWGRIFRALGTPRPPLFHQQSPKNPTNDLPTSTRKHLNGDIYFS